MRIPALTLVLLCVLAACAGEERDRGALFSDSLTQRQRDSIKANSRLPGANAIGRALQTADSASARASVLDSIRDQPAPH